jgi:hypothetical protein
MRKWLEAAGRSGVAGVQVTFVLDDEFERREARLEPCAQALLAPRSSAHQAPAGAGLILPFSQNDLRNHEHDHRAVNPNTLNLTHTFLGEIRAT